MPTRHLPSLLAVMGCKSWAWGCRSGTPPYAPGLIGLQIADCC